MSRSSQRPPMDLPPRPLLSGGALVALIGGACVLLWVLLPMARERLDKAQSSAPSSLSLNYMELSLLSRPGDNALRRTLVNKQIESGQLDKARATLQPLLAADPPDIEAHLTLLELDRAAWAALAPDDTERREHALAQVEKDVQALAKLALSAEQQAKLAKLYLELDRPVLAAQLLDRQAREQPTEAQQESSDAEARVQAADAAWLAAGVPSAAAELQAFAAARRGPHGLAHARLAIQRAQGVGDSAVTRAMIERMRELYPDEIELLELAVQVAEGYSAARAYELAAELARRVPSEAKYHRLLARLAEATGHQLRALDEYVWLVRHGGTRSDRDRAIALAKANWDLPLLRELLGTRVTGGEATPQSPSSPHTSVSRRRFGLRRCQGRATTVQRPTAASGKLRSLREALALDEALGDHQTVLRKLSRAVAGEHAASEELWLRKYQLEYALGDRDAALATARSMLERFEPSQANAERVAALQLELGDVRGALATLRSPRLLPLADDAAWQQRLANLAFEAGDIDAERAAYERLVHMPGAAMWHYQRLWELAPDREAALKLALSAFERFESEAMFYAALSIYQAKGEEAEQVAWLRQGEQYAGIRARADYWQARIALHQQRSARAMQAKDYPSAKRELERAATLLDRAKRRTKLEPEVHAQLLRAQHSQTLAIGLSSDDVALIAAGYVAREPQLSARERVYILQKLGRKEEALLVAKRSLAGGGLSEEDRGVIELDARALSEGRKQYARLSGDAVQMDGLSAWNSTGAFHYSGPANGLHAEVSLTQLQATSSQTPVLLQDARELSAMLAGRLSRASLELGVRARDENSVRPFGSFGLRLAGDLDNGTFLRFHVNKNALDTARQRAWGARDAIELETALPLGHGFYVSARGLAEAYYHRVTRDYVGAGLSLDAGAGVSFDLPGKLGAAGLRVTGRVAPRYAKAEPPSDSPLLTGPWLPQSSQWAGVGASIGRGKLDAPPLIGRTFCYLLDGAAGWLWPLQGVGFSAQAGFGFSVFGADLLTVAARGGNVVGSTVWSANLGYGVSIDR